MKSWRRRRSIVTPSMSLYLVFWDWIFTSTLLDTNVFLSFLLTLDSYDSTCRMYSWRLYSAFLHLIILESELILVWPLQKGISKAKKFPKDCMQCFYSSARIFSSVTRSCLTLFLNLHICVLCNNSELWKNCICMFLLCHINTTSLHNCKNSFKLCTTVTFWGSPK